MKLKTINIKKVRIRSAKTEDYEKLNNLDLSTYYEPVDFEDFNATFFTRKISIKIIEYQKKIIGYFIIRFLRDRFVLLRMCIKEEVRRAGIGSKVIQHLKSRLSDNHRYIIEALVDERNLSAQLFLKKNEFKWVRTKSNKTGDYDLYCMEYVLPEPEV